MHKQIDVEPADLVDLIMLCHSPAGWHHRVRGNVLCPEGLAAQVAAPNSGQSSLLFVCDPGKHRVQAFDANSGSFVRSIGTGVTGASTGQFNSPVDVVVQTLPSG